MNFKKASIFIFLLLPLIIFTPTAIGKQNQPNGHELKVFRELLANINATFISPEGFTEAKPVANDKFQYNYALQLPDADFEVRFQVNTLKTEWKSFEKVRGEKVNPDSLYSKIALAEVKSLAADGRFFSRSIPGKILQEYNADLGRTFFFNLAYSAETNHYQYGLLVVIQKNHYGNICVVCLSNERGPAFFKSVNKLRECLRFND